MSFRFPFRRDNRRPDGYWDVPDASEDNIIGTSVDPYDPVWPRWKQSPPQHGEGEFISDEPFFDIDEVSQKAEFYPPGRPLTDKNVGGNPASRQRVGDMPGGNLWRRRLLVGVGDEEKRTLPDVARQDVDFTSLSARSDNSFLSETNDRMLPPQLSDPRRSELARTVKDRTGAQAMIDDRLGSPRLRPLVPTGEFGPNNPRSAPLSSPQRVVDAVAPDVVKKGLFVDADSAANRSGRSQSTADWISARNEREQKSRPLSGYKVQAIPRPSDDGYEFSIRLSRGQPQTNLGGALVGHIRREGGYYDPNGVYYRLEDHEDRFGPTEFDEIVDFVSKGKQEGATGVKDKWAFAKLPPGWRSDVTVTATWTYVDKLTKADAKDKLEFMENPNFSGTFLSKKGTTDWAALGFRSSTPTAPMVRKIPSQ